MATKKQKAAARRNIKKALATLKRTGHKKHRAKKHHAKKGHKKSHRKGHIPLHILERRLKKLGALVHKRKGR